MKIKIIGYLIDHPGFTKVRDIADALGTDPEEINFYIPELMEIFWDYEIELICQGERGMMIRGSEKNVRKCAVEVCDREDLVQSIDLGYMPKNDGRVELAVTLIANQLGVDVTFDPDAVEDLIEHMYKAVERVKKGMAITNPYMEEAKMKHPHIFEVVNDSLKEVYPELVFPLDEQGYIVLYYTMLLNLTF